MANVEQTITIKRPVEDVFAIIANEPEKRGVVRLAWHFMRWSGNRAWRQAIRTLKDLMEANAL